MDDLHQRLEFMKAIDALKEVRRKTYLISESRFENSAEHSWAVATLALVLADYAPEGVNVNRVIKMLLIHDVVEVDAGDILLYDKQREDVQLSEQKAADRLFGMLPKPLAKDLRNDWDEFEAEQTATSQFAAALDRFIPVLHNIYTGGRAWQELGIQYDQIIEKNQKIEKSSPALWDYLKKEIDKLFAGRKLLSISIPSCKIRKS